MYVPTKIVHEMVDLPPLRSILSQLVYFGSFIQVIMQHKPFSLEKSVHHSLLYGGIYQFPAGGLMHIFLEMETPLYEPHYLDPTSQWCVQVSFQLTICIKCQNHFLFSNTLTNFGSICSGVIISGDNLVDTSLIFMQDGSTILLYQFSNHFL